MPKLRGAVVGLGVGRSHAEAYAQLPQTELVAVCDTNEARLRPVAEQYRCRAYASVEDLLADREVELVSVATPHPSHAELSIRAMRAGKHVLVEKPMAVDLAEADRMIRVSRETGRTLAVVFQRRWWPAARNVRRAIDEGKIGRPILGQCSLTWWRTKAYYDRDPWRGRWDTEGGGVLINQAIHAIDMFQWLMGGQAASSAEGAASSTEGAASSTEGVEEVVGRWTNLTHPYLEVEDTAAALLRFRGGALGVLSASSSVRLSQHRITIHGSKGHSVGVIEEPEGAVGYNDVWTVPGEEELPKRSLADHVARGEYIYRSGRYVNTELDPADDQTWPTGYRFAEAAQPNYHARQIADLVDALRSGRRPLVDGVEGRKSVAILLAIYQSGRTGQPVRLSQPAAV
ncbi:MAG TPA: Gfo/Idh/MocA family oxidoreductase [Chloroflexota bacterium]|nr:Gfo/Idh/MocA family oxidoreductase [Chloroflexota bacterium]